MFQDLHRLNAVINQSGIWKGDRHRTHGFRLSSDFFMLTESQRKDLERLGVAIVDCLLGLSHLATIALDPDLNYRGAWGIIRQVCKSGVPKIYHALQAERIKEIPALLKVDLMLDQNGDFKIAEIDGHNKHGLGYTSLGVRFREALYPDQPHLPGAVHCLAQEIKRRGHQKLILFYADQERFYIPEFEVAARELARHGVACRVVGEMEADPGLLQNGLLLDLPHLYHRVDLYDLIIGAYQSKEVDFIIPPKPFLGAKGVLALLRNDGSDVHLESILRAFIHNRSLELVRSHLPKTWLVGKKGLGQEDVLKVVQGHPYVLKQSISSGMHGTVFSDGDEFERVLKIALDSQLDWILQEMVDNQPQMFSHYDIAGNEHCSNDWFMRVTAHNVGRELADILVTARQDKAVHGAPDCLQLPTILVP